ncbi:MAG: glycosyltransferase [Spirulina sp.]
MIIKSLHIIPSINPLGGGSNLAAIEIVRALRKAGVDAEIATTHDFDKSIVESRSGEIQEFQNIPVRFFSRLFTNFKPLVEFAISLDYTKWLEQNINNYQIVHIHSFFSYLCTRGAMTARKHKIDYLITPHGQLDSWVINQKRWKKNIYSFLWERNNLDRATAIHCTTANEIDNVREYGLSTPTFTVPLGVAQIADNPEAKNTIRQRFGQIKNSTPIILFLARLHPKKRVDFLIQVLSQLKDRCEFHLLIAGTGKTSYVEYLKHQVAEFKLQENVTFVGFVQGEAKDLLLQGSDIFVLPSYGENFGIAVAEAMSAGLAIAITPEVQISSDLHNQDVGFVIPGETEIWVETIKKLLESEEMRQNMGNRGKIFAASRYQWETTGEQLASIYQKILDSKN